MTRLKLLERVSSLLVYRVHLLRRQTNRIGVFADMAADLHIRPAVEQLAVRIDERIPVFFRGGQFLRVEGSICPQRRGSREIAAGRHIGRRHGRRRTRLPGATDNEQRAHK